MQASVFCTTSHELLEVDDVRFVWVQSPSTREIALPELLGTHKGIAALTAFLQESGAFTFTGEKPTPKNTPTFEAEAEPPDIDSEDEESDLDQ